MKEERERQKKRGKKNTFARSYPLYVWKKKRDRGEGGKAKEK